ncbi:MAG TPA: ATP-binding protein [Candidatus Competibacteraceae bacterium]|nr:ATP-binding protein [Candidatus Competibacteraceae bacterium]HQD54989.1 ATP-binding protein [Candidatus Competibacteraceae bacterium]
MTRVIRLEIDSRPECIELLSDALCGVCRRLPATEIDRINLAMVEAVNNAVEHAYRGEPGHPVWVELELASDHLRVRVCDRGHPMDPHHLEAELIEPDPADPATWSMRSRGLFIIRNCMDEVRYETRDGVNILAMNRRLANDPSA